MMRRLLIVLLAVLLAAPLAGCGKKASPKHPPGSNYPREYPTE